MRRIGRCIVFVVATFAVTCGCQSMGGDPLLKLTFHVVDDEGKPVEGARAGFGGAGRPKNADSEGEGTRVNGLTDTHGLFTGEVAVWDATRSGYEVSKQGHYTAWASFSARPPVWGKWQPWNPTIEVLLKRKKNPVPMYAKLLHSEVPAKGVDVGYDLIIGDWVAPHGKGKQADMVFNGTGEVTDRENYRGKLTVMFPGRGNGLIPFEVAQPQQSPLRMPYVAPADGYESQRTWRNILRVDYKALKVLEKTNDSSKTQNFFIRVRSEVDTEGKVVRAWYGKIHAPFSFGLDFVTKLPGIYFTYYVNPDGTRNIEYDPKRNLLKSPKRHDPDYENLAP